MRVGVNNDLHTACDHSAWGELPCMIHELTVALWAHAGVTDVRHATRQEFIEPFRHPLGIETKSLKRERYLFELYRQYGMEALLVPAGKFAPWMYNAVTGALNPVEVQEWFQRWITMTDGVATAIEPANEPNYDDRYAPNPQLCIDEVMTPGWDAAKSFNPHLSVGGPCSDDVGWQTAALKAEQGIYPRWDFVTNHQYSWHDPRGYLIGLADRSDQFFDGMMPYLNGRGVRITESGPRPNTGQNKAEYFDELEAADLLEAGTEIIYAKAAERGITDLKVYVYRGRLHETIMTDFGILDRTHRRGPLYKRVMKMNGVDPERLLGIEQHSGRAGEPTVLLAVPLVHPTDNRMITYKTGGHIRGAFVSPGARFVELPVSTDGIAFPVRYAKQKLHPGPEDVNGLVTGSWE